MRLSVSHLVRRFGETLAVDDLSFALSSGEIYGFVGPNGAGKTTTLRILATLDEPTSGDAALDGVSVVERPEEVRRAIGYMPDHLPSHADITVHEYLDFFARAYALRGGARRQVVESVEEFTQLTGIRSKLLGALSKGMKQRLSLARALIHDPALLLLDEPAAGLDPRARVELRELLRALAARGKAILISSHILSELAEICDGAIILENGRTLRAGSIQELLTAEGTELAVRVRALGGAAERERLHRALLEAPHVEGARILGQEVEADLAGGEEAAAELLARLVAQGHGIVEFRSRHTGLEEVFLRVTQGEIQ